MQSLVLYFMGIMGTIIQCHLGRLSQTLGYDDSRIDRYIVKKVDNILGLHANAAM
jgi:hypothetical protein